MTRLPLFRLAVLSFAVALSLPAGADDPDEFQVHYQRARDLFLAERYDDAQVEFKAAYDLKQLPRLLVNIGQCHRMAGKLTEALDSYNAYLKAVPSPDPEVKQKVDDYIHRTQTMLAGASSRAAIAQPASQKSAKSDRAGERERSRHPTRFVTVPSGVDVDLHAITGRAPDDLWAAGDHGTLLHYDGKRWASSYEGWDGDLRHLVGRRADDVWAVGNQGACLHFDGSAWHVAPRLGATDFAGVWIDGPGEAWVVDEGGALQHFDGTDWFSPPQSGERREDLRLTATAASAAPSGARWMVGHDGGIARWDGKTLLKTLSGTRSPLFAVWQSAPDDAWVVGATGALLHHDGKSWKAVISPTKLALFALWGNGPDDLWAAGGTYGGDEGVILHHDGKTWTVVAEALRGQIRALWGTGPRDMFAAGQSGAIYHYDGDSWTEMPRRTTKTLWALWGSSATDVWAAGDDGLVLHYNGRTWSTRFRRPRGTFHAVWETAADDVWAVGDAGAILHREGSGWSVMDSGTTRALHAVWASSSHDAWAAGDLGLLLHWDGTAWSAHQSGVKERLTALWGSGPDDVWAGGDRAVLLHYDGHTWAAVSNPFTGGAPSPRYVHLPAVASIWGAAPNDIWAVGELWFEPPRAALLHYNGARWSVQPSASSTALKGVAGSGARNTWIVGGFNYNDCSKRPNVRDEVCPALVLHHDGKAWRAESSTDARLESVWTGGGEVWAVGEKGTVVRLRSQ